MGAGAVVRWHPFPAARPWSVVTCTIVLINVDWYIQCVHGKAIVHDTGKVLLQHYKIEVSGIGGRIEQSCHMTNFQPIKNGLTRHVTRKRWQCVLL